MKNVSDTLMGTLLFTAFAFAPLTAGAAPGDVTLASLKIPGFGTTGNSYGARLSGDGRYVVYDSSASDLAVEDANSGCPNLVIFDAQSHVIRRVSARPQGAIANDPCKNPSISADGRFVAFSSDATNLVPNDTEDNTDIFVYDRQTGLTENMTFAQGGPPIGNNNEPWGESALSADGRFVAFTKIGPFLGKPSDARNGIFLRDRQSGALEVVSVNNAGVKWANTASPSLSADGRYVAFLGTQKAGESFDGTGEILIRDRQAGVTEQLNIDADGTTLERCSRPSMSPDARYVSFQCDGSVFLRDRQSSTVELVSVSAADDPSDGESFAASPSGDGRFVVFSSRATNLVTGDTNDAPDVFLRDRQTGTTTRLNVGPNGEQVTPPAQIDVPPAISADGRFVAFTSAARNLYPGDINGFADVFVRETTTGTVTLASFAPGNSLAAGGSGSVVATSHDARYVFFDSSASALVPADTNDTEDVFMFDRQTSHVERLSLNSDGEQLNGFSRAPSVSGDGRYVAFMSGASNLDPADTNSYSDIYVRDRETHTTQRVSVGLGGDAANGDSTDPHISADGRYVTFQSNASNLAPGPRVGSAFVFDRQTGVTQPVRGNHPSISGDGRFVAYASTAIVYPGDTGWLSQVFVWDRLLDSTARLSVGPTGVAGNGNSQQPTVSSDGRYVAYHSTASNIVAGDANDASDIFVYDRQTGATQLVSVDSFGQQIDGGSHDAVMTADGRFIAFQCEQRFPSNDPTTLWARCIYDRESGVSQPIRVNNPFDRPLIGGEVALSEDAKYLVGTSNSKLVAEDLNGRQGADTYVIERATD